MNNQFPNLKIIPIKKILLHEEVDQKRVLRLKNRIKKEEILKNPLIVGQIKNKRLILLDGANRLEALKLLDIPDILVQMVEYEGEKIKLQTWNHLLIGLDKEEFLKKLSHIKEIKTEKTDPRSAINLLEKKKILAMIQFSDKEVWVVGGAIQFLSQLVNIYKDKLEIHRVKSGIPLSKLKEMYPKLSTVIRFSAYTPSQIVKITTQNQRIPSGITRHIIENRALHVNLPLKILKSKQSLASKNQWLKNFIQKKILDKRVRFYAEPTYLFDE